MGYYAKHAASMAAMEARLADELPVIAWNGQNYPLIPGTAQRRQDLVAGGFDLNADLKWNALVSSFGAMDATALKAAMLQTQIAYLGDNYKVMAIGILPGGLIISAECNSLTQGA